MGAEANRRRARQAARRQSELAQQALDVLQAGLPMRWIQALEHRIEHPEATLTELADSMSPPMTKHAYAALLRRALRGGGFGPHEEGDSA